MNKYKNARTVVDGLKFDSKREADRWQSLVLLQKAGHINQLERQVVFELAPAVRYAGSKRQTPALRYVADFSYWDVKWERLIIEDVKGCSTQTFRVKRHLMMVQFGIDIKLT